jgi:ankyrin repeat protein
MSSENNNETGYVYSNTENEPEEVEAPKTLKEYVEEGDLAKVKELLRKNSRSNEEREDLRIFKARGGLVHIATRNAVSGRFNNTTRSRYLSILTELLQSGFSANELDPTNGNHTPLNTLASSARTNAEDVLATLVYYGAKPEGLQLNRGKTTPPLYTAVKSNNPVSLNAFLTGPFRQDPNLSYPKGNPLLHTAIYDLWPGGVRILLAKGVNVAPVNLIGDNAMIAAVKLDPSEEKNQIIEALLGVPKVSGDFINKSGQTALSSAIGRGDFATVDRLLEDPRFAGTVNFDSGKGTALQTLLTQLSTVEEPAKIEAIKQTAEHLIRKGASVDNLTIGPYPLFHYFVEKGSLDLVEFLLTTFMKKGKNPLEIKGGPSGFTPLTSAAYFKNLEMIRLLLSKGAKINNVSTNGFTALTAAISRGNLEIVNFLLDQGATTPQKGLHAAVFFLGDVESPVEEMIRLFIEKGSDLNERDTESLTPLMVAAVEGNEKGAKILLELGADPTIPKEAGNPLSPTAYDMAGIMGVRLIIAQFIERDEPRFRGFLDTDFLGLELLFSNPANYVICPFCFTVITHGGGCMYVFEHSCLRNRDELAARGDPILPIIHEKLYNRFKDAGTKITVCYHCNRAGYTWPEGQLGGQQLVGHAHIVLGPADPTVTPSRAPIQPGANPYERTTCIYQGGGGPDEKFMRFQVVANFMCYLNQQFVGKISNKRAHLLTREMFWEAPLYRGRYLTQLPFLLELPDQKIKDVFPAEAASTPKQLVDKIQADGHLFSLCEKPSELLPLPEGVVNGEEAERVYPNIPRFGTNAVDLAPLEAGVDEGDNACWFYSVIDLNGTGHGDRRPLWRFRHRQQGGVAIYDHGSAEKDPKELICGPCVESFLRQTALATTGPTLVCFNSEACSGHFHPSEVEGKVSDETYQAYRAYYNRNPVLLGGRRIQQSDYPPLIVGSDHVEQDSCPIYRGGRKGKKRTTRRRKLVKKTRKAKRYSKTRKQ